MAIVRREEVIDNWSILDENGQVKEDDIFINTRGYIEQSKAPNLRTGRQKLALEVIKGLLVQKRGNLAKAN